MEDVRVYLQLFIDLVAKVSGQLDELLVAIFIPDVDVLVLFEAVNLRLRGEVRPVTAPADLSEVPSAIASMYGFEAGISHAVGACLAVGVIQRCL